MILGGVKSMIDISRVDILTILKNHFKFWEKESRREYIEGIMRKSKCNKNVIRQVPDIDDIMKMCIKSVHEG